MFRARLPTTWRIQSETDEDGEVGYWCVVCGRFLPAIDGRVTHDEKPHPFHMWMGSEGTAQ